MAELKLFHELCTQNFNKFLSRSGFNPQMGILNVMQQHHTVESEFFKKWVQAGHCLNDFILCRDEALVPKIIEGTKFGTIFPHIKDDENVLSFIKTEDSMLVLINEYLIAALYQTKLPHIDLLFKNQENIMLFCDYLRKFICAEYPLKAVNMSPNELKFFEEGFEAKELTKFEKVHTSKIDKIFESTEIYPTGFWYFKKKYQLQQCKNLLYIFISLYDVKTTKDIVSQQYPTYKIDESYAEFLGSVFAIRLKVFSMINTDKAEIKFVVFVPMTEHIVLFDRNQEILDQIHLFYLLVQFVELPPPEIFSTVSEEDDIKYQNLVVNIKSCIKTVIHNLLFNPQIVSRVFGPTVPMRFCMDIRKVQKYIVNSSSEQYKTKYDKLVLVQNPVKKTEENFESPIYYSWDYAKSEDEEDSDSEFIVDNMNLNDIDVPKQISHAGLNFSLFFD